jgi:predicted SnoaL-like aldol condensation-catalyzing enzyme
MFKPLSSMMLATFIAVAGTAHADPLTDKNKRVIVQFYELAFAKHRPAEAAKLYLGTTYTQHNPRVPDGPEVFSRFFDGYFKQNPDSSSSVKRVVAEKDLVVIHSHSKRTPDDRGQAIVDMFRVEGGKIVEHWDVMQAVPETSANQNTMF